MAGAGTTTTLTAVFVSMPLVLTPVSAASASSVTVSQAVRSNDTIIQGKHKPRRDVTQPGQAYFWMPMWQEGEREADHDLATGNYRDFEDAEAAIDWIFNSDA